MIPEGCPLAAVEEIVALRAALEHYAQHRWTCPMFNPSQRDRDEKVRCDCEGRTALEALGRPTNF